MIEFSSFYTLAGRIFQSAKCLLISSSYLTSLLSPMPVTLYCPTNFTWWPIPFRTMTRLSLEIRARLSECLPSWYLFICSRYNCCFCGVLDSSFKHIRLTKCFEEKGASEERVVGSVLIRYSSLKTISRRFGDILIGEKKLFDVPNFSFGQTVSGRVIGSSRDVANSVGDTLFIKFSADKTGTIVAQHRPNILEVEMCSKEFYHSRSSFSHWLSIAKSSSFVHGNQKEQSGFLNSFFLASSAKSKWIVWNFSVDWGDRIITSGLGLYFALRVRLKLACPPLSGSSW